MTEQELQMTAAAVAQAMKDEAVAAEKATREARKAFVKKVGHYVLIHATHFACGAAGFALKAFVF
jgi:hypothetical protein